MKPVLSVLNNDRRRLIALILIGIAFFLAALVIRLPAAQAWGWFGKDVPAQVYGIRGTAWNGEAAAIVSGPHRVDTVRWNLQPGSLLRAQLGYDMRANIHDGRIQGLVRTGLDGSLRLDNVRFDMDANELLQRFGNQGLPATVGGRVEGFIQEAVIDGAGRLQQIKGLVHWVDGSIRFGETMPLGSYALRLNSQEGQIAGQLMATDAVLRMEGDLRLDPANGEMVGEVIVQALEGTAETMVQVMRFAGIPRPAAENRIDFTGNLNNPLGFRGKLQ